LGFYVRGQAPDDQVEVVAWEVAEVYAELRWLLLELRAAAADGVDGRGHEHKRVWTGGTAQVGDRHATAVCVGSGTIVLEQACHGFFYHWL